MSRHSKLQIQVLHLYRRFLRVAKDKPGVKEYIQSEFRNNAQIPRTDLMRIEHLFRKAERQLEQLQKSKVSSVGVFQKDKSE